MRARTPAQTKKIMKETDLNYLEKQVRDFISDTPIAIREILYERDIVNWFVVVYSTLDTVKEVTTRYNNGVYGDVTLITTADRITIIDNATKAMSWVKVTDGLISYDGLMADLYNMTVWLNAVYFRLLQRA